MMAAQANDGGKKAGEIYAPAYGRIESLYRLIRQNLLISQQ